MIITAKSSLEEIAKFTASKACEAEVHPPGSGATVGPQTFADILRSIEVIARELQKVKGKT